MFSHLTNLNSLNILGNVCIRNLYSNANTMFPTIQRDLATCSASYSTQEAIHEADERVDEKFDLVNERIDRVDRGNDKLANEFIGMNNKIAKLENMMLDVQKTLTKLIEKTK
jgi:hypothetical protein